MFSWSLNYRTDTIKLGRKIGSGAQAEIFEAKCGLDEVVVKRFLDSKHKSTKQEVAIIQELTHKHIVQFYHVHHDMIVMEYVEGGNLAEAIVGKALKNWEVKTQIAKHISLGLAFLHSEGIIHCDIKSSNILLTQHKEARICDFGHAIRVGESGVGGTLQWMAPELLQDPPLYTSKSDVYALGMVMWEMSSGSTRPYREHTPDGMIYCILNGILEEYPNDTPKIYAACIRMCWTLAPDDRPAAKDVLPDIESLSRGHDAQETQELRSARSNGEKPLFSKALAQYFQTRETPSFMAMLKVSGKQLHGNKKTMDWFNSSAIGHESAAGMIIIGGMHYEGRGVEQDYGKALDWYLAASEAGVAVAMLKISQMYRHGRGVKQDDNEADSWYSKAEEAMAEQSKFNSRIVHHSSGVSEHHRRTLIWFNNIEGAGSVVATFISVGDMYSSGGVLEQDYCKALEWYLKASDAGNADAAGYIGFMHCNGQGVKRDYSTAMEWFRKASDAGNANAMFNIAAMYRYGLGVPKDHNKTLEWYHKASDAGHASANTHIRIMSHRNLRVEQTVNIPDRARVGHLRQAQSTSNANTCRSANAYYSVGTYHAPNPFFSDSDFDSSTGSIGVQDLDPNALNDSSQANISAPQQQSTSGQAITYHYFCNFPECDYHSARSDPVKRHRDTHYLDYKPYICTYCHSSSARRDSTREHCLKVHKDDSETAFRYDTTVPKPEGWIAYKPKRSPWPPIIV